MQGLQKAPLIQDMDCEVGSIEVWFNGLALRTVTEMENMHLRKS